MRLPLLALLLLFPAATPGAEPVPLTEWRALDGGEIPATWAIADGEIRHTPGGGDIRTARQYGDFTLDFEWQISPGGNSGVFYRAPARGTLGGPEYQILDNAAHADGKSPLTSAASAYAVYAPVEDATRPAGQWNSARILVSGRHVEHWLNGVRVLSYELGSPDWLARVAASKFAGTAYGMAPEGYIMLQDHGAAVAYRRLILSPLP